MKGKNRVNGYYTTAELAKKKRVTTRTIYRWYYEKNMPGEVVGRLLLIPVEQYEAWEKENLYRKSDGKISFRPRSEKEKS